MARTHLDPLLDTIYGAALDPSFWTEVIAGLHRVLGTDAVVIFTVDRTVHSANFLFCDGFSQANLADYQANFTAMDERVASLSTRITPGRAYRDGTLVSHADYQKTSIYNDFYRPIGLRYASGALVLNDPGCTAIIGVHRAEGRSEFADGDFRNLEDLSPHLTRALRFYRHAGRLFAANAAYEAALDALAAGLVLLDRSGRIAFLNREARRMVAAGQGVAIAGQRLVLSDGVAQARLDRQIGLVRMGDRAGLGRDSPIILAQKLAAGSSYKLLVVPLRADATTMPPVPASVAIVLLDGDAGPISSERALASLYGLSRAEAALAVALANGQTLQALSEAQGTSIHTVRSQLQQTMAKMDVHRQSDLTRQVLADLGHLAGRDGDELG